MSGDGQYLEDVRISFAMWCDEHGLTHAEGVALAERISDELLYTAEDRWTDETA